MTPEDRNQPGLPQHPAAAPQTASALGDHWYLLAYDIPSKSASATYGGSLSWKWKRIFFVSLIGLVLGVGLAAIQLSRRNASVRALDAALSQPQPAATASAADASAPTKPAVLESKVNQAVAQPALGTASAGATASAAATKEKLTPEEVNRLKARNRRLEALISVLRKRSQASDKKTTPEQTTVIGQ